MERKYWLGFSLVSGVGPVRTRRLLEHFGSLGEAWAAPEEALRSAGLDARACKNLFDLRGKLDLDAELARLDKLGVALLTWDDPEYPPLLKELRGVDQAPAVLYLRGSLLEADRWAVAVVGTRSLTAYGRQVTHQIAAGLAANGVTVISGLALGADAEAHRAALEAGGRTIAVLPCGLDNIYPQEHRGLAAEIMQRGALLSPFALGKPADQANFQRRNRVLSGMALGVVVTEAGEGSGALVTARAAMEQGREVFAVPGNITAASSQGTNQLIRDGAQPIFSAEDVLRALQIEQVAQFSQAKADLPELSSQEAQVLALLSSDPAHVDDICRASGLAAAEASSALLMLQLKGAAREVGPMIYVRT